MKSPGSLASRGTRELLMMWCRSSFIPHPKGSNDCSRYSGIAHVVELFIVSVNPPSKVLALGPDGYARSVEAVSRKPTERVNVEVCVRSAVPCQKNESKMFCEFSVMKCTQHSSLSICPCRCTSCRFHLYTTWLALHTSFRSTSCRL